MSKFETIIPSRSDLDWCWYLRKQGRIGEALERTLHDIGVMQPGGWAQWRNSTMTDTGSPVEMIFSAHGTCLSLRTEVDDPASDPHGRVAKVCDFIKTLGHTPPPAALREVIGAAQGDADLRFGAWLGLDKCDEHESATLYAEFPGTAADLTGLVSSPKVNACLRELGTDATIQMLSFNASTRQITLFCETTLDPHAVVPKLADVAGVSATPLLSTINQMREVGSPRLGKLGFSFTMQDDGTAPLLSLQLSSKDIFATDGIIGPIVRDYAGDHLAAYRGLADMLWPAPNGQMHHGDIGLQALGNDIPLLSVGVAAPWACPLSPI
ncbi:hypothetical protein [Loktanella sp. Alg231-35]|uniref:hypothetical protein n=1 Tax=Loktanella sp. Alg231-35 TaxID=1922220 RepID=UPI00131F1C15|nr:hypothetical protein [Loktanella sp. Alg231-35]